MLKRSQIGKVIKTTILVKLVYAQQKICLAFASPITEKRHHDHLKQSATTAQKLGELLIAP